MQVLVEIMLISTLLYYSQVFVYCISNKFLPPLSGPKSVYFMIIFISMGGNEEEVQARIAVKINTAIFISRRSFERILHCLCRHEQRPFS